MLEKNILCLITGASGGFGKAIATTIASCVAGKGQVVTGCTMVLTGRQQEKLEETKIAVLAKLPSCSVDIIIMDQKKREACEVGMSKFGDLASKGVGFDYAFLFNNAGCLGDVSLAVDEHDWTAIEEHCTANVTSHFYIASRFVSLMMKANLKATLINTSSLLAIKPASYTSLYCTGKAAADMLFAVLALEHPDQIKTLNYGPGPMRTDMQTTLENHSKCEDIVKFQKALRAKGELVEPMHSAEKLLRLLDENTFISGSHVDFYDVN